MKIYIIWINFSIFLFFSIFGATDADGYHNGWFISTRPGWLWFTILLYLSSVLVGLIIAIKIKNLEK